MTTTEELVSHLANLTFLLDYYDKHGATRNKWVVKEFDRRNQELIEGLREEYTEKENQRETRKG